MIIVGVKNKFTFYLRTSQLSRPVPCSHRSQNKHVMTGFNPKTKYKKISCTFSCSPKYTELGNFVLLQSAKNLQHTCTIRIDLPLFGNVLVLCSVYRKEHGITLQALDENKFCNWSKSHDQLYADIPGAP